MVIRLALVLAISLPFVLPTNCQVAEKKDPVQEKMMQDAAEKGFRLAADLTVTGNVSIEAVLLPPSVTRGVFGKAVSDRYAAVELIVSNRSRDAALVVHSIFIDYSRWLLSGSSAKMIDDCPPPPKIQAGPGRPVTGSVKDKIPGCGNPLESWQSETKPNQIAAAEYRIPRGQLLDAQQWSFRNLGIRGLEAVGSIAAGYVFAFKENGIAKGIASYNGNFLPAMRYLFPDSSIDQANRISDLGFRVNKMVPKESSEILVAFFPIDRFLTPGIKKIFQMSPAIFFVPHAAALDPKIHRQLTGIFDHLTEGEPEAKKKFATDLRTALVDGKPNWTTEFLDRISLNNVRIIVGGAMTVDVDSIPATIEGVEFDETDLAALWAETGVKKGTVRGRYLSNGTVTILEAGKFGITELAVIAEGSTDTALRFQMKLTTAIPAGSKLTFRVDKKDKHQKPVEGTTYDYVVKEFLLTAPAVDKVERSGDNLTITGKRFFSTAANPLTVMLRPGSVSGVDPVGVKNMDRKPTEIKIDLAPLALKPACWTPEVAVGNMAALGATPFAQAPVPKIDSAKKNGTRVVIIGKDFIDLKACGKALTFEIAEQAAGSAFKAVANLTPVSPKEVSFDFPASPADGKFKVRILIGGVEADTKNVE